MTIFIAIKLLVTLQRYWKSMICTSKIMPDYRKKWRMLDSCECKHPPLVNDVIQVIWLLFQQHRTQTPFCLQCRSMASLVLAYPNDAATSFAQNHILPSFSTVRILPNSGCSAIMNVVMLSIYKLILLLWRSHILPVVRWYFHTLLQTVAARKKR